MFNFALFCWVVLRVWIFWLVFVINFIFLFLLLKNMLLSFMIKLLFLFIISGILYLVFGFLIMIIFKFWLDFKGLIFKICIFLLVCFLIMFIKLFCICLLLVEIECLGVVFKFIRSNAFNIFVFNIIKIFKV